MKYAILGPRGGINRISDTEPQFVPEGRTFIEITDEQAATVQAGREAYPKIRYFWVNGKLGTYEEKQAADAWVEMSLEEQRATKIKEFESARYEEEIQGTTVATLGDTFVRTDKETQSELGKALALLTVDPAFEIDWKFPGGTIVRLDKAKIDAVAQAVFGHVQATRTKFKVKAELAAAATTSDELTALNW